ncbi:MAG: M1 family metallopeptidase [Candidatus Omnitrophica bacterium]|nr:M1 family metallopeptidase [Candidatus Omnitrophota bacterium]
MRLPAVLAAVLTFSTLTLFSQPKNTMNDIHSYANASEVTIQHLSLDLSVDFTAKTLSGTATLTLKQLKKSSAVVLDTRGLTIQKVTLNGSAAPAKFTLGKEEKIFGAPLSIPITPTTTSVTIHYSTSPDAGALQWLAPSQTAGKQKPFLFTQSQAILARTWVPCMDGPGVRMTYDAVIRTTPDLLAVMSAGNPTQRSADGIYRFAMKQPIPSYLLALAVGDLEFRSLGARSGVYAEPSMVDKSAHEFADLEAMISAAEALYGPYRWERYDLLVLPPSFPFGGMENPRLTFATPTILAGDRSLVSLVAHELAHSWSGNLVTNSSWNDFWLNEGFTVYFEQRIMERMYGREYTEMLATLTLDGLKGSIASMGKENPDTRLKLDLTGRDPDEGVTDIAYNKGYFFLRLCEETFGREAWDAFLKGYFDTYAFKPMTTELFLEILQKHFGLKKKKDLAAKLTIDAWVYSPGLPANCPVPVSQELEKVTAQKEAFLNGSIASKLETSGWTTHHWLYFLRSLPDSLRLEKVIELDYAFYFTRSGNAEILCEWFQRCIKANYETAYGPMRNYLMNVGRRKLVRPLYEGLAKTEQGKAWAKQVYEKARPGYHSVTYNTIDGILK